MNNMHLFNVELSVTDGGYFKPTPSTLWSMRSDRSSISKFYYITEGRCEIVIEGEKYAVSSGDWIFIPSRAEHSYHNYPGEQFAKYWMHFDMTQIKNLDKILSFDYRLRPKNKSHIDKLFSDFVKCFGRNDLSSMLAVKSIVYELLHIFISEKANSVEIEESDETSRFSELFAFINNNMSVHMSNDLLAEVCHMHPNHFIRAFRRETGRSPQEYVLICRMERAKFLLETTDLHISEIAERLGFIDGMYFSKVFKRRYSITPSAYRRSYINNA